MTPIRIMTMRTPTVMSTITTTTTNMGMATAMMPSMDMIMTLRKILSTALTMNSIMERIRHSRRTRLVMKGRAVA